ncbi:MAG: tripartite tricarboxylate transporter TctB family protein [Alphaproteobacteria bacterium]|nr:tripartite tricarboxylate transporter TctB family protein [Alphaproteobacteria bacterium]
MNQKTNDLGLGAGVIAFGVFLLLYAIPVFVSAPSNVRALVLSPLFWPDIIAWIIIILGVTLIATRVFGPPVVASETTASAALSPEDTPYAIARLAAAAVIMVGLVVAIPVLGMVLSTGIAFALISMIVKTPRPVTALIVAILLPLVLYAFFAHVAGVSVPQGRFITLP